MADPWAVVSEAPVSGAGKDDPWAVVSEAPAKRVSVAKDVGGGLATGLKESPSGLLGMFGDAAQLGTNMGLGIVRAAGHALGVPDDKLQGSVQQHFAPTSQQVNNVRQAVTGQKDYQPQTFAGQAARTVGRNLPNALLPGSAGARVLNVLAPAAGGIAGRGVVKAAGGDAGAQDVGEAVGSVLGGVAGNVRIAPKPEAPPVSAPKPMDLNQLKAAKTAAYTAVDNAGVRYSPEAFGQAIDGIVADAAANNLNPLRHEKAASMLDELKAAKEAALQSGEGPTLTQIDHLRQVVSRDVARASDGSERFFGKKMIAGLDNFVEGAGPDAVQGADPQAAADLIGNARDLNRRFRKVEAVSIAADRAKLQAASTGSGGNVQNATRQKLRTVLQKTQGLTDDERNALSTAVSGGPFQNALRLAGKVSPEGNGLMLGGHVALGMATHGTSLPTMVAGIAAKAISDGLSRANVQRVMDLMAVGGQSEQLQLVQMAQRDAKVANLINQLKRVSLSGSTVNALSGASQARRESAGRTAGR